MINPLTLDTIEKSYPSLRANSKVFIFMVHMGGVGHVAGSTILRFANKLAAKRFFEFHHSCSEASIDMGNFTLYIKQKGGSRESAEKAITLLKTYLPPIIQKNTNFSGTDAILVDENTSPSLQDTDVIVYLVRSIGKSVISAKGGDVSIAENDQNTLGLTDLNLKICEVYFDRLYEGSPKELAGACYHESAHIKSNMDNSMHKDQNGFLKASPDYNGSPTESNTDFMAKHLGRKVTMNAGY